MDKFSRIFSAISASASAGVVMLIVLALSLRFLDPFQQGLFLSLFSLCALVQVGDFGLSYAVMQKASHLSGSQDRDFSFFQSQVWKWAFCFSGVAVLVAGAIGLISLYRSTAVDGLEPYHWSGPWLLALVGLFFWQLLNPIVSFKEGSGFVSYAWRVRMAQAWIGGALCTIGLLLGAGLYSISLYWIGAALTSFRLASGSLASLRRDANIGSSQVRVKWRTDIWPFQWRIGLSALAGFLIFRATTVVVLAEQGAVVAGEYGLVLAAMNMVLALTTAWPNSQAAHLGRLLGENRFQDAVSESNRTILLSTLFCAFVCLLSLFFLFLIGDLFPFVSSRFSVIEVQIIVFLTCLVHHLIASQAVLLRAQLKEPLLLISLLGGILNLACAFLAARHLGVIAVAASALVCSLVGLMVSTRLYRRQIQSWRT